MNKKGFTLIELLAVIIILAIIIAIAVPRISTLIRNSGMNSFESNTKLIFNAIRLKVLEDPTFDPTTIDETNIKSVLNINDSNIHHLTIKDVNGTPFITLVGKNNWDNLVIEGTVNNLTVRSGLLLWLDAGNADSYSGSGTSWYDLSGNNGTATAFNNPLYNSFGYFNFDGVNDYFRIVRSDINGGSFSYPTLTVELWFRPGANGSTGYDANNLITSEDAFEISIGNLSNGYSSIYYATTPWAWTGSTANLLTNTQWNHLVFVHSLTYRKIYVNGAEVFNSNNSGAIQKGSASFPYLTLMGRGTGTSSPAEGDLAVVKLYDIPLSASEILQNFNNSKTRFGL